MVQVIMSENVDRITPFFRGKTILIAGVTGFVGKVFIEKLLRQCSDIGAIYVIIRNKHEKCSKDRFKEMFDCVLFDKLKTECGLDSLISKFRVIPGDLMQLGVGISAEDRAEIANNVEIIYNMAANVRFNDTLTKAVLNNTRGTREMLALAKECKRLELFLHVSTAYCFPKEKVLEEKPYDPPHDPHHIINLVELVNEEELIKVTNTILEKYPNTYSYSKALAEGLVNEASAEIPTLIIRPSVIVPILHDPVPGWTDNLNGPVGLLLAAGCGVLRVMQGDKEANADFLPIDIMINGMFISTFNYIALKDHDRKVTNYVSSAEVMYTFGEIKEIAEQAAPKYPFDYVLWYPGGFLTKSWYIYKFFSIFFHWIPAALVDTLLRCIGQKPILWKVQQRISQGVGVLKYYTMNKWEFRNDTVLYLRTILTEKEAENYCIHSDGFDVAKYFEKGSLAARRYIFKYKDENLPKARKLMTGLYFADRIIKVVVLVWGIYWSSLFFEFLYKKIIQ